MSDEKTEQVSWFSKLDPENQSFIQSKGWHLLEGPIAAIEAAKAYRELQKLHGGVTSGEYIRPPKPDATPEEQKAFWQKLGAPGDANAYKFDHLKYGDGTPLDPSFQTQLRAAAAAAHMPAGMLDAFVSAMMPMMEADEQRELTSKQAAATENRINLDREWGSTAAANKFVVNRAIDTLQASTGMDLRLALETLVNTPGVGYAAVQKLFLALGTMMGEGRFVPGSAGGGSGSLTVEQAQAKLAALGNDPAWVKRWREGGIDSPEGQEKTNLIKIITGANR